MEKDYPSSPIPAWIRIYAFGFLILIVTGIVIFCFYFKIQRTAQIKIRHKDALLYIECGLAEFETLEHLDTAQIQLKSDEIVDIVLKSRAAILNGHNILIPASVINQGKLIEFPDGRDAWIIVENSSLLSKLFKRSKPI